MPPGRCVWPGSPAGRNRRVSPDPAMPADEPLTSTATDVERVEGVDEGQFRAEAGTQVHCFTCRREFAGASIDASAARRLEGASDPADMLLVVAVACPHCGASGALTLNYGPEATLEDAEVLRALERDPATPPV